MQVFATLGLYLILAFVLPGFCYLLAFGLCFPEAFQKLRRWLPPEDTDAVQGFWLFSVAVVGGLLLSSVTFALELVLRESFSSFAAWYPKIDFGKAPHGPESYTSVLVPSAIMHFNVGSGIFVILAIYLVYTSYRKAWIMAAPADAAGTSKTSLAGAKIWLAVVLTVVVLANLFVAKELFHRISDLS
jgi:hypothetical protein